MSQDVERWKRELEAAGWNAASATAWRAPDGGLWRGPFGAWKELQRRAKANGTDTNWPLCDVLTQLVEWAKHLHDDHDCDCHGWEARSFLIEAANRYAAAATAAPQVNACGPARPDDGSECAFGFCPRSRDGCSEYCVEHHGSQCSVIAPAPVEQSDEYTEISCAGCGRDTDTKLLLCPTCVDSGHEEAR